MDSAYRLSETIPKTLIVFSLLLARSWCCPPACVCMWKYGKQTVECINKDLLIIPQGFDQATQVFEFSGNHLDTLQRETFLEMGLINLQRIRMARCRIRSIHERTFAGLTNLVELDLSGNLLELVPSQSFHDCPSLMRLTLSNNPIGLVKRSAFGHLTILNTIELQNCDISLIEDGAFQGLQSLEWLYLNENKISEIKGLKYFPASLKGIYLQDNPWICDCHLTELRDWIEKFNIPRNMAPVCTAPLKFQKKLLSKIPKDTLACLPEISPTTFYLEVSEGRNISLLCHVKASPEAQVNWSFQGQLLQNDTVLSSGDHLIYYIEEGTEDKQSELFIYNTNKNDNGTFVCSAENPAGITQSNFTVKVVLKKLTKKDADVSDVKIDVIIVSSAAISTFMMIIVIVVILKCRRDSHAKKRNSKATLSNSTKDSLLQVESIDEFPDSLKSSSKLSDHYDEMVQYKQLNEQIHCASLSNNPVNSPLKRCPPDRNPDLINGTEGVYGTTNLAPKTLNVDNFRATLNPKNLDSISLKNQSVSCYRTLPHRNRRERFSSRSSFEAEFPNRNNYLDYTDLSNVRYTADGYPVRTVYDSSGAIYGQVGDRGDDVIVEPCPTDFVWPSCLPASAVLEPQKRCAGAQTVEVLPSGCDVNNSNFVKILNSKKIETGRNRTDNVII